MSINSKNSNIEIKDTPNTISDKEPVVVSTTENKQVIPLTNLNKYTVSSHFSRADVESLGNQVRLVDSDEESKLELFCYIKCGVDDSDMLKQCRGVVFNGDSLVMKAFPFTIEYNQTEVDKIDKSLDDFSSNYFYDAYEGALVRIFYFKTKWYISTHRKLDAFRSKWASRESFGDLFKKGLNELEGFKDEDTILEKFQDTLDKDKQYMFLIRNNASNRIVCTPPEKQSLLHVGTFIGGVLVTDVNVGIPHPHKLEFKDSEELREYISQLNPMEKQGVICFSPDNRQYKILNKSYQDLFKVRGNEPSIPFRYLQLRMNRSFSDKMHYLYPDMVSIFDEYEDTLFSISREIYVAYVQRFIKKRYVIVPPEEFSVIRECHSWHLSDRVQNRISLDKVIKVMNQQTPTNLNHMIRRFRTVQLRKKDQQTSMRPRVDSALSRKSSVGESPEVRFINNNTPPPSPLLLGKINEDEKNQNIQRKCVIQRKYPRKNEEKLVRIVDN